MPRFSLTDLEAARPEDPARMAATTEEDIRRHKAEDGVDDLGGLDSGEFNVRGAYPDVRELRRRLALTQEEFARDFGLSVWTVRDWEQHRAEPEGPARVLLKVIEQDPDAVRRAVLNAA